MKPLRLIFMGTPMFALPALEALTGSEHKIVAVYSQPPRPAGRGQKLTPSPVHQLAEKHGIPVLTHASLKSPEVQSEFRDFDADAAIVAAYGLLLPKAILDGTRMGCINVHPSLLPRWRGAAPLNRTLMAGDTKTGVCIMQMDEGLDTGDVLLREDYDIPSDMTTGQLHDVLATQAGPMILKTLAGLDAGTIKPEKQSTEGVTYAKKIEKEDCRIDWTKSARDIFNQVRGLAPKPGAFFMYNGEAIKLLRCSLIEPSPDKGEAGEVTNPFLTVQCGDGNAIGMLTVQRPGKGPMLTRELLNGFPIPPGTVLE